MSRRHRDGERVHEQVPHLRCAGCGSCQKEESPTRPPSPRSATPSPCRQLRRTGRPGAPRRRGAHAVVARPTPASAPPARVCSGRSSAEPRPMSFASRSSTRSLTRKPGIGTTHLEAALSLWDYAARSALYVFGDSLGDPMADEIWRAVSNTQTGSPDRSSATCSTATGPRPRSAALCGPARPRRPRPINHTTASGAGPLNAGPQHQPEDHHWSFNDDGPLRPSS